MASRPWHKFAALLRMRERQERLKAQSLADAQRDVERARSQRGALDEEQRRLLVQAGEAAAHEVDAPKVKSLFQYERHVSHLAVEKDSEIHVLRKVEDKRRAELEEALKRKKIVERLSERARQDYKQHVLKEEQKLLDETASVKAAMERQGRQS